MKMSARAYLLGLHWLQASLGLLKLVSQSTLRAACTQQYVTGTGLYMNASQLGKLMMAVRCVALQI
jgi:hypothetical protein